MDLENFHLFLKEITSNGIKEAEAVFEDLIQNNLSFLLQHLLSSIVTFTDNTVKTAITLLGRTATKVNQDLLGIEDENFHTTFQSSLLSLVESPIKDPKLVPLLSNTISNFAFIYQQSKWPNLCESLLQFVFQQDGQIITPSNKSPYSTCIATDILWHCINNESIILNQEDILQNMIAMLQTIFQEPTGVNGNQLISTVKLTFSIYMKTQLEQILPFSNAIVEIIPHLPKELIEDYLGAISLFSESNILFFSQSIENFIPILMTLINDFDETSDLARIRSIDILNNIIINEKYYTILLPKSFEIYQLFLLVLSKSKFDLDPMIGFDKSCTMTITEDAIQSLSNYFSENEYSSDVSTMFTECISEDSDFGYVIANLIGYSNSVKNDSAEMYLNNIGTPLAILPVFQATIINEEPKMRIIAVESLNSIMKYFGYYTPDFGAEEYIQLIVSALSKETDEIIMTSLVKSLKIYVKKFSDYIPYCDDIMGMLGNQFDQMNEDQQILTLKCYFNISKFLKEKFIKYMQPIFSFMGNLLGSYNEEDQHFPINLFFICMKLAPQFSCLSDDDFNSISQTILTFISSISDFSQLSSNQMDSINGAICSILKRNSEQFLPFASEIVSFIFQTASKDIEFENKSPDSSLDDDYKYGEDIVIFNPKTNMHEIYSKSSIDSICEALNTLKYLLEYIDEVIKNEDFFTSIVNVIFKNFENSKISSDIRIKLFYLINNFFESSKKHDLVSQLFEQHQEGNKPVAFQIYSQELLFVNQLISVTNDLQSFAEFEEIIEQLEKSFLIICKVFYKLQSNENNNFSDVLNQTLMTIYIIYQKTLNIRVNTSRISVYTDDFISITSVESITGSFFGCIFTCMSSLISSEIIQTFCDNFFAIQPVQVKQDDGLFISSIVLNFWVYFSLLYPDCSKEQVHQIVGNFRDLISEGKLGMETNQSCLSAMLHIVIGISNRDESSDDSNRYGFDDLLDITLQYLSALYENNNDNMIKFYSRFVNKELLILAEKLMQCQKDPSLAFQLLINLMPITLVNPDYHYNDTNDEDFSLEDIISNFNVRAAQNLIAFSKDESIKIFQDVEGASTLVVMAALINQNISNNDVKKDLIAFIKSVTNDKENNSHFMELFNQVYKNMTMKINVLNAIKSI